MFPVSFAPVMHALALYAITIPSFLLAAVCFWWWWSSGEVALLLVGWVTFGMAFDFLNHILGIAIPHRRKFLQFYSRVNFAALCFGIPFTAMAGSFVLAEIVPDGISGWLVANWFWVLHGSLIFGALFLFARYKPVDVHGGIEYVLDKSHGYTNAIFVLRRALLAASLLIALGVVADSVGTNWLPWASAFTGVFVASIPLHILHKQIPSMLSEVLTQVIAVYGCWQVFIA